MQQLKQLKRKKSLHIPDGLSVRWRRQNPGHLNVPQIIKGREGEFTQNNGVIAYVHEGELYVTPYCREAVRALKEAGLTKTGNLFVPFSNGDVPQSPVVREKWDKLCSAPEKGATKLAVAPA